MKPPKLWIVFSIIFCVGIIIGWLITLSSIKINSCVIDKESIQNMCIGWANHKVLEKQAYTNSFATNVIQQKYWIEVYENCMEEHNG